MSEKKTPATDGKTAAPAPTKTKDAKITKTESAKKADASDKKYIKGSRGGCYYLTESGKKVYVKDKFLCENYAVFFSSDMKRKTNRIPLLVSAVLLLLLNSFPVATTLFGQSAGTAAAAVTETNDALALGNPSRAKTDLRQPDNYLVAHAGYTLSYNKSRGAANWVAWHLEKADIGNVEWTNAFAPDTPLPRDWWIKPTDLVLKGYDRGHLCPSEERTDSEENNRETFLMSNMVPQTSRLNRGAWKSLETYIQKTIPKTNSEAYIIASCYGDKGRIKDKITIPTNCYKIAVIMPEGDNDLRRITKNTRVIAVDMPNESNNRSGWRNYITTVDDLESKTGYDFLSALPDGIEFILEAGKDNK